MQTLQFFDLLVIFIHNLIEYLSVVMYFLSPLTVVVHFYRTTL